MSFKLMRTRALLTALIVFAASTVFFVAPGAAVAAVCPKNNPDQSIQCTGSNSWCGNTCQAEPASCPAPKTRINCDTCGCSCPAAYPNDCTAGTSGQCQATNASCASVYRQSICNTTVGAQQQVCGSCVSGYQDCSGTCLATISPSCQPPRVYNPCTLECSDPYILTGPTSPQSASLNITGDIKTSGGDLYLPSSKAIRVDGFGITTLNIGNWDGSAAGMNLDILGNVGIGIGTAVPLTADSNLLPVKLELGGGLAFANNSSISFKTNVSAAAYPVIRANSNNTLEMGDVGNVFGGFSLNAGGSGRIWLRNTGELGLGVPVPNTALDINGAMSVRSMAAPAAAPLGQGRIYFDSATSKFKISENGGAYANLAGSGIGGSGTANKVPKFTAASTLGDSLIYDNGTKVGIGETTPGYQLDVKDSSGVGGTAIVSINQDNAAKLYTGTRLARQSTEKWFVGMNDVDDKLRLRTGGTDVVIVDAPSGNMTMSGSLTAAGQTAVGGAALSSSYGINARGTLRGVNGTATDVVGYGVWGEGWYGVYGNSPGNGSGVSGVSGAGGYGVYGQSVTGPGVGGTSANVAGQFWDTISATTERLSYKFGTYYKGFTSDVTTLAPAGSIAGEFTNGLNGTSAILAGYVSGTPYAGYFTGDAGVTGTAAVGGFRLATGAGAGKVLTSDAAGLGTWQPAAGAPVTSVAGSGVGISVSPTTGSVIVSNTGVTSLVAGTGISISGATGAVTVSSVATGVGGSGTANFVPKFTAGTTLGNSLIQDNGTNVGVGTSPSYKLHVIDGGNTGLRVQTNLAGGTVASYGGNGDFMIDAPGVSGGRFTVLQDGKVGIGSATPRQKLDVWNGDLVVTGTDVNGTAYVTSRSGNAYFGNNSYSNGLSVNVSGVVGTSGNLNIGGVVPCIQGVCPPNNAIRLTPNLHFNSAAGNAVIVNWDNGTTGGSQTFRVGNGAAADAFYVNANGDTVVGGKLQAGLGAYAVGNYSVSLGRYAQSGGNDSVAIGYSAYSLGKGDVSISTCSTDDNNCIGQYVYNYGNHSIAIGSNVQVGNGDNYNVLIGNNISTSWNSGTSQFVIGSGNASWINNGTPNSLMVGFNSNSPTLFVGGGNGTNGSTGNVGVGTIAPNYKLTVAGDVYANGGWLRSSGGTGWYNESYGGGWFMTDATWIRQYPENNLHHVYMYGGYDSGSPSGAGCGGGLGGGSTFQVCGTTKLGGYTFVNGELDVADHIWTHGNFGWWHVGDIAEPINTDRGIEKGDVVVADPSATDYKSARMKKASKPYDPTVIGVMSTNPSLYLNGDKEKLPLAVSGLVPVKADASYGAIHPGDFLTTSATPGYAMKADDADKRRGAIIGKALETLLSGKAVITMIATLQ